MAKALAEKSKNQSRILRYQYKIHMKLFMHSDNYIQQRTYQFVTMTAILFAVAAVFIGAYVEGGAEKRVQIISAVTVFTIAVLGFSVSVIWLRAYLRSCRYRELHRNALRHIEKEFLRVKGREHEIQNTQKALMLGAFELRNKMMYENIHQPDFVRDPMTWFSRRSHGLRALPLGTIFVWIVVILLSLFGLFLSWNS